jgi:tagatose 1,6-diphosphate aldolase
VTAEPSAAATASLSAGKIRGLMRLADRDGRFRMVAVDQRPPLFRALSRATGVPEDELAWDEVAAAKGVLVRELAPHASAVLMDPVWALPRALASVPGDVGLLSTLEGYDVDVVDGERRSRPIRGWSVELARRSGADAIKVLAWHRPDVSAATARHQDDFVRAAGEACRRWDLPFVLELLDYPLAGDDPRDPAWLRAKSERVLASLRHYAEPAFGVDLFKLELPFDPHRVREVARGALDGVAREPLLDRAEAQERMAELDAASPVPWVLLSAGVGPTAFAFGVELAVEAGASGFLAGRALWLAALDAWPDREAVASDLRQRTVPFMHRLSARVEEAVAWTDHRRYAGALALADAGPSWLTRYAEAAEDTTS